DYGKAAGRYLFRRSGPEKENDPNRRRLRSKNACRHCEGSGPQSIHTVDAMPRVFFLRLRPVGLALRVLLLAVAACGKVGDPKPPFIRIPEAVKDLTVTQTGYNLILTWTNPPRYVDGSAATNLARVRIQSDGTP